MIQFGARLFVCDMIIRPIKPEDCGSVVLLLREFAAFEDQNQYSEVTKDRLHTAMFGEGSVVEGLIACDGERAVGCALFYPSFSSFRGQRGLYLEDLYVKAEYRGTGLGRSMLREIARIAAAKGCERIDFLVLDQNAPAIQFYENLAAVRDDDERHFKFTDEAFIKLAS